MNAKDVEWLTVELADDSEEITGIQCELNKLKHNFNIDENSKHEQIMTQEKLLQFKHKQWQLKIPPDQHEVTITVKPTQSCDIQKSFKCQMKLLPVNINTSSLGHKLQGRSKDIVISYHLNMAQTQKQYLF